MAKKHFGASFPRLEEVFPQRVSVTMPSASPPDEEFLDSNSQLSDSLEWAVDGPPALEQELAATREHLVTLAQEAQRLRALVTAFMDKEQQMMLEPPTRTAPTTESAPELTQLSQPGGEDALQDALSFIDAAPARDAALSQLSQSQQSQQSCGGGSSMGSGGGGGSGGASERVTRVVLRAAVCSDSKPGSVVVAARGRDCCDLPSVVVLANESLEEAAARAAELVLDQAEDTRTELLGALNDPLDGSLALFYVVTTLQEDEPALAPDTSADLSWAAWEAVPRTGVEVLAEFAGRTPLPAPAAPPAPPAPPSPPAKRARATRAAARR